MKLRRLLQIALALSCAALLSQCAHRPKDKIGGEGGRGLGDPDEFRTASNKESSLVDVFFATDRAQVRNTTSVGESKVNFGPKRGELTYGKASVLIPPSHQLGLVERPRWYDRDKRIDSSKHVTLYQVQLGDLEGFLASMNSELAESPAKQGLLFIHGFNTTFKQAVLRTAQITHDVNFQGVPIAFSWPSEGQVSAYAVDAEEIGRSERHLVKLLKDIQERSDVQQLHVLAHSMGTRLFCNSLDRAREQGFSLPVRNIILAAPDIDREIFITDILPQFPAASRTTLYANGKDWALLGSGILRGRNRLGRVVESIPGVDVIDVAQVNVDLLGHSDYGKSKPVVSDIRGLVVNGLSPAQRPNLVSPDPGIWRIVP